MRVRPHAFRPALDRPTALGRPTALDRPTALARRRGSIRPLVVSAALTGALLAGCSGGGSSSSASGGPGTGATSTTVPAATNVYAYTGAGMLNPAVAGLTPRVYVPNSESDSVMVIDPTTYRIVSQFPTGREPQHVTPSWDLKHLYADNDLGDSLTPIDPVTGTSSPNLAVPDPYNLYFTPDGTKAIVVAEREHRLDFRQPNAPFDLIKSVPIPLPINGVDHMDFSADGTYLIASAEYTGDLVKVDVVNMAMVGSLKVGGNPIDVKLSPDGSVFYVANQGRNGVSIVDAATFREIGFIPTGRGAHGLYQSRDAKSLYVSNRGPTGVSSQGDGVSVIDFASRTVVKHWPFRGSPDMGGVSPDGTQLWLTGRYDNEVYVIDTSSGQLLHRIKVGKGPHGLCFFPQPGRFSMGHTGVYR